jgi:hypothetical protein
VAWKEPTTPRTWQPFDETCRGRIWNVLIKSTTSLSICWSFYNDAAKCSVHLSRYTVLCLLFSTVPSHGAHGGAVCLGTSLQTGRSRVRFQMFSLEFIIEIIHSATKWQIVRKSGILNLLEHSGHVGNWFASYNFLQYSFAELALKQRSGERGGCFRRVETRKPKMEKWRQQGGRFHTKGAEYRPGVLLRFFTFFLWSYFKRMSQKGPNYEAAHVAGDTECRVRNKWWLVVAWITRKRNCTKRYGGKKTCVIDFTFAAFIRKVRIDGSPFGGGNFSVSTVRCVG